MVQVTGTRTVQIGAAAAALVVAQMLAVPTALARPLFPLTPACYAYTFDGTMDIVQQSPSGTTPPTYTVSVIWQGGKASVATTRGPSGNNFQQGLASGALRGSHADFTVKWFGNPDNGPTTHYQGDVFEDRNNTLGGTNTDSRPGYSSPWYTDNAAVCSNFAPHTVTVIAATDIYDKPDGVGNKIGSLEVGEQHPLMEPCHDDWCRIGQIELGGFPGLENGTAWVYTKDYATID